MLLSDKPEDKVKEVGVDECRVDTGITGLFLSTEFEDVITEEYVSCEDSVGKGITVLLLSDKLK